MSGPGATYCSAAEMIICRKQRQSSNCLQSVSFLLMFGNTKFGAIESVASVSSRFKEPAAFTVSIALIHCFRSIDIFIVSCFPNVQGMVDEN